MDNNYSSNNSGNGDYFFWTLYNTFVSTKFRLITFCIVLILQFFPYNYLIDYDTSYSTFKQQLYNTSLLSFLFSGIIKYLLVLYLFIISPKTNIGISEIFKFTFLTFITFIFFFVNAILSESTTSTNKHILVNKSFIENKVSIFGKVVFSSYGTTKRIDKFYTLPEAKKLSKETDWLIVIVQIDKSEYFNYPGLKNFTRNYNQLRYEKRENGNISYSNNIPESTLDIPDCIKFELQYDIHNNRIINYPLLPQIDGFIKFYFDPIENGFALLTSKNPDKLVPNSFDYEHSNSIRHYSSNLNLINIPVFK